MNIDDRDEAARRRWQFLYKALTKGAIPSRSDEFSRRHGDAFQGLLSKTKIISSPSDDSSPSGSSSSKSRSGPHPAFGSFSVPPDHCLFSISSLDDVPSPSVLVLERDETQSKVTIEELSSFDNTGNICVWPSEEVLTVYCLEIGPDPFKGKRVLEIAAGSTGLASLIIASHFEPSSVIISDGNETCSRSLEDHISMNRSAFKTPNVQSLHLEWSKIQETSIEPHSIDLIIGADCLFLEQYHDDLIQLIKHSLSETGSVLLLAPPRPPSLSNFVAKMKTEEEVFKTERTERYSEKVWERHIQQSHSNSSTYQPDFHLPVLLSISFLNQ